MVVFCTGKEGLGSLKTDSIIEIQTQTCPIFFFKICYFFIYVNTP